MSIATYKNEYQCSLTLPSDLIIVAYVSIPDYCSKIKKRMNNLNLTSAQSLANKSPSPRQILIADGDVEDLHVLIRGLKSGVDCWILEQDSDVQALLREAVCSSEFLTLHLLGHGMPGAIELGNVKIDIANWTALTCGHPEYAQIQSKKKSQWQKKPPLAGEWNICFWSCNTGEGSIGKAFVQHVADCTGANVYASSGLIGHSKYGGSWRFNVVAYPRNT